MKVKIEKSKYSGTINVPSSKSYSHRYLLAAMLSKNSSVVNNIYYSNDVMATLNCMSSFGCDYKKDANSVTVFNNNKVVDNPIFDCNESGSTLRFLIPIALTKYENVTFKGTVKLIERGIDVYEEILSKQNIQVIKNKESIIIKGKLKAGTYDVNGSSSSQYITGLLFALPLLDGDSIINIIPPFNSYNYVDMTLKVLEEYGIKIIKKGLELHIKGNQNYIAKDVIVEGDYSNSAFLDALNYLDNKVNVLGLVTPSLQGDKVYLEYFEKINKEHTSLSVSNCIDLAPVLMALASIKHGVTLTGTNRLKIKESDRAAAMQQELYKIGVNVDIFDNFLIVHKCNLHQPIQAFDSHNDHRIAMALSILSSLFDIEIDNYQAVSKSYPTYFEDLIKLGGKITYEN